MFASQIKKSVKSTGGKKKKKLPKPITISVYETVSGGQEEDGEAVGPMIFYF